MSTASDRGAIIQAVRQCGSIGIRALAKQVGRKTRDVGNDVEVLEQQGVLLVTHPGGGYRDGERMISLVPERCTVCGGWYSVLRSDVERGGTS